jgi:HAMP domain-containing protein/signal transduction histidine kinase/CheY-like chemotaxis protein
MPTVSDSTFHESQVTALLNALVALKNGRTGVRLPVEWTGVAGKVADAFNEVVELNERIASEFSRLSRVVGKEGKLSQRTSLRDVSGFWRESVESVNELIDDLVHPTSETARVIGAVAQGDLSQTMALETGDHPLQGEFLRTARTINTMVDQLGSFASEVTRVAREVGTEGILGGQAQVRGVAGTWKDLTDSVNMMAGNLTGQVRNIAEVATAVANGDLSKKVTVDVKGEILELKNTINTMVDQLRSFGSEVTRVAREVGTEGKLGGQAKVEGVSGTWKDLTDSVNSMAGNLTAQVRNIAGVTTAVANGDLSRKITVDVKGEILELKNTINTMVDQLGSFASEVTRVAREVGTEGNLGGQAQVPGVAGVWKDLTDNVNFMASNLTSQVRNIAEVTTAVANGDLSKTITVDVRGEILELKDTINTMVDQLGSFASEVTRVAREVGTEGKLGGQAQVRGVAGTWKDLTDSVNMMAGNLTSQVRNIADVTKAVAAGVLSRKITVDVKGEILELKNTINTMVDQLGSFASEVTRVAREVGTEGKLGGQAKVEDVAGTWKDLTDSVNMMAGNLTGQVRNIADVTKAVATGDLSKKITVDVKGEISELKNTINTMVDQLRSFAAEVTRVAREVGTEGKLGGQATVEGVAGTWKDLTDSVNSMASNLTSQVRNIAEVTTAVANGDLSKKITVDVKGEILELKNTVNTMVDQLRSFAAEVTRVAKEVGTEGKLGGQAKVEGVSGTWKDLTDSVNMMAANLTSQVRGIAKVVTSVANGNLKRKLTVEAKGEIAELADTINSMIDTLATFADQVTTVAREVGVEGQLGGQAKVPGAAGTWKALTENVNQLADNLTRQVRAIAEVATAVTKGDLTRSIALEAEGEMAALKDTINEMIRNLKDTTLKNSEQDWLKTNLAKFSYMLQGQRDLTNVGRMVLSELCPVVAAQQAEFYVLQSDGRDPRLTLLAGYAAEGNESVGKQIRLGQGIVGQCAQEKQKIILNNLPPNYLRISSGLGEASPRSVLVLPLLFEGQVKGVLELASFEGFNPAQHALLDQLTESIGIVLHTIEANMRTEGLLKQAEALAEQLATRHEQLQRTNEELQEKASLLVQQNEEVERKNREVELARLELEVKARQLALTSKYKSEFLANMSHELRTPLNSLLILSDQLTKNTDGNLTPKQTQFAKTIHSSGNDLLMLINDILDLAKIESGTVVVDASELRLDDLRGYVERTFNHVAEAKSVDFFVRFDSRLPRSMTTDAKRLQQIIKNLLSNAFKFTHQGQVTLTVEPVQFGWNPDNEELNRVLEVLAFAVTDTGIGIAADKLQIIFEAFHQADGSTSRKYGGTGLGLAISRELSVLLGGEICLVSTPNQGSTFTLYLPTVYAPPRGGRKSASPEARSGTSVNRIAPMLERSSSRIEGNGANGAVDVLPEEQRPYLVNVAGDDRDAIQPGDRVLLIVENDMSFARFLLDTARERGFKGLVTSLGATVPLMAREYKPDAITLDINLPDIDGWRVLDRIKNDLATRHIPVCVISTDEARERSLSSGALAFVAKPIRTRDILDGLLTSLHDFIARSVRRIVVVEADRVRRMQIVEVVHADDVLVEAVADGRTAQALLRDRPADCVVLGPRATDFLDEREADGSADGELTRLPVIVYGDGPVGEDGAMKRLARSCTVRRTTSPDRLLDISSFFLHRSIAMLPEEKRQQVVQLHQSDKILRGHKVLVVDDDIRNIFALTAVLEEYEMVVISADNGRDAIQLLLSDEVDIVLMDIMMPEMDGMETLREIRKVPKLKDLPIVAVTAKAMKGDREKCIEAGAWDYLSKPVDTEQMLDVLRNWLHR